MYCEVAVHQIERFASLRHWPSFLFGHCVLLSSESASFVSCQVEEGRSSSEFTYLLERVSCTDEEREIERESERAI